MAGKSKGYAVAPLAVAVAAVAAPLLLRSVPALGFALQRGFALVCHQQPERSFFLFGGSVAVCARCLGIYFGAAAGLLLRLPRQMAMRILVTAVTLNLLDWLAETLGLHGNWILLRFVLGIALGTAASMIIVASSDSPTQAMQAWTFFRPRTTHES